MIFCSAASSRGRIRDDGSLKIEEGGGVYVLEIKVYAGSMVGSVWVVYLHGELYFIYPTKNLAEAATKNSPKLWRWR